MPSLYSRRSFVDFISNSKMAPQGASVVAETPLGTPRENMEQEANRQLAADRAIKKSASTLENPNEQKEKL